MGKTMTLLSLYQSLFLTADEVVYRTVFLSLESRRTCSHHRNLIVGLLFCLLSTQQNQMFQSESTSSTHFHFKKRFIFARLRQERTHDMQTDRRDAIPAPYYQGNLSTDKNSFYQLVLATLPGFSFVLSPFYLYFSFCCF